jgi:hypothetical protein
MAESVSLNKSYSALNEALIHLFDESGIKRSVTIPYVEGQSMADHVNAVGQAANQVGGLAANIAMSAHHSGGRGYGSGEGHTVLHSADKLRSTIIPAKSEPAKNAIAAAQTHLNNLEFLLGKTDPNLQAAQSQLNLVKPTEAAGMNLFDLAMLVIGIMHKPTQAVARAHSGTKKGGHAAHLRAPEAQEVQEAQEAAPEAPGGAEEQNQAPTGEQAAPAAPAAPEASQAHQQAQG